jgi:hypothetical protein
MSRLGLLVVMVMGRLAANAATNQLSGAALYDAVQCPGPPEGFEDFTSYPGLVNDGQPSRLLVREGRDNQGHCRRCLPRNRRRGFRRQS